MRSLFIKIFLWFWLAMTLSGVALAIIAITQMGPVAQRRHLLAEERSQLMSQALTLYGDAALKVLDQEGRAGLRDFAARLKRSTGVGISIFEDGNEVLSDSAISPAMRDLVAGALQTGQVQSLSGNGRYLLALPLPARGEHTFIIAGDWPDFSFRQRGRPRIPFTRDFGLRIVVSFIIGGIICYGLAWHLTRPIRRLREATHQLAAGDLTARVGKDIGPRRDEIAGLGREFDRMAERIETLMTSQQRLIRDISHELRSPLARLNVALELARRGCGTPDAAGPLDRIEREAERLNDLIGELLTLTLLESGAERMDTTSVELSRLVREIAGDADFEAKNTGRSVRILASEIIRISGSEELLRRAVENIVRNAVRHTAEGTEVEITLQRSQKDAGPCALIRVRDHGSGVPEEALGRLFQPFYRVADARERQTGGTGIGLAITERAVHLHNGSVRASNHPAGGLIVEINLPCSGESSAQPS
jgi:signal transduction histidine kinase